MADLIDELRSLAAKIEKGRHLVNTEEATKNAFVMPFIAALGYDVFDPTEVTPELIADVGVKKGEKIDYAVMMNGEPIMLFECKHHGANLDSEHASQLFRYFSCTRCRVAVLTNGIEYRFFSDLDAPNRMDSKPFLAFKITDLTPSIISELKKFTKGVFDLEALLSTANELKYTREIKSLLVEQLQSPSEEFVKFCANGIGVPRMTQSVKEQFGKITRKALSEFVSDRMGERLKTALQDVEEDEKGTTAVIEPTPTQDDRVETTEEELEAFYAVKSILREVVDVRRVAHRDQQSYFGVLLDDNNRKPICRLHFNARKQKYIGLFDESKNETRMPIDDVDAIFQHADQIRATVLRYEGGSS